MQAEVGALHEAMAGLHGEMGAIQRELDETKASQDKLAKGEETKAMWDMQEYHPILLLTKGLMYCVVHI